MRFAQTLNAIKSSPNVTAGYHDRRQSNPGLRLWKGPSSVTYLFVPQGSEIKGLRSPGATLSEFNDFCDSHEFSTGIKIVLLLQVTSTSRPDTNRSTSLETKVRLETGLYVSTRSPHRDVVSWNQRRDNGMPLKNVADVLRAEMHSHIVFKDGSRSSKHSL